MQLDAVYIYSWCYNLPMDFHCKWCYCMILERKDNGYSFLCSQSVAIHLIGFYEKRFISMIIRMIYFQLIFEYHGVKFWSSSCSPPVFDLSLRLVIALWSSHNTKLNWVLCHASNNAFVKLYAMDQWSWQPHIHYLFYSGRRPFEHSALVNQRMCLSK